MIEHLPFSCACVLEMACLRAPGVDSCDRDYDDVCPEGLLLSTIMCMFISNSDQSCCMQHISRWVNIGAVKGGSTEYCHGGTQYFGPCSDEVQSFSSMSTNAKKRWSAACQADGFSAESLHSCGISVACSLRTRPSSHAKVSHIHGGRENY